MLCKGFGFYLQLSGMMKRRSLSSWWLGTPAFCYRGFGCGLLYAFYLLSHSWNVFKRRGHQKHISSQVTHRMVLCFMTESKTCYQRKIGKFILTIQSNSPFSNMAPSLVKFCVYIRLFFSRMKATVDDGFIEISSFDSSKRRG